MGVGGGRQQERQGVTTMAWCSKRVEIGGGRMRPEVEAAKAICRTMAPGNARLTCFAAAHNAGLELKDTRSDEQKARDAAKWAARKIELGIS
jgi:hypothetical protein